MGGTFSEPVPALLTDGHVGFVLRSYDKLRLLHANKAVYELVVSIVKELNAGGGGQEVITEAKYGAVQFRLPGSPFAPNCGRDSAYFGKFFILRLFEQMNVIGYDFLSCVDLSRAYDQGTLIFKQGLMSGERSKKTVIAVAPYSTDKLHMVNCTDGVVQTIKEAVLASWKPGIKSEGEVSPSDWHLYEIKMKGNPWSSESSDESLMSRRLIIELIGRLSFINWKLHATVNIRSGCGNCLFFIYDERHLQDSSHFAIISPGRWDRLRLIGFDSPALEAARLTILRFYQKDVSDERYASGVAEYKLKGYPFSCAAEEAVTARQLICRLLELLRDRGWDVITAMDLGQKRSFEKSILVMGRCESARLKYACIAPADLDRLYLINFPHQIGQLLKEAISKYYLPGVSTEESRDASSIHEVVLQGPPWSQNSSFNLHARSMLIMLIKELSTYGWKLVASGDVSAKYVHQENGIDYPIDVQALFFSFNGIPAGTQVPNTNASSVSFAELKVCDLEA